MKSTNTGAVTLVRYPRSFLKWTREESPLSHNGLRDKKIHVYAQGFTSERWHRLYESLKEGRRGFTNIEDCRDASIQRLEGSIKKTKERQIAAASNGIDNTRTNRNTKEVRKQKREEKTVCIFQAKNWRDLLENTWT